MRTSTDVIPCPVSCVPLLYHSFLPTVKPHRIRMVNRAPSLQPTMTRRISGIKKRTDIHFCTSVRCFYEIDLSPLYGYAPVRLAVQRFSVRLCPGLCRTDMTSSESRRHPRRNPQRNLSIRTALSTARTMTPTSANTAAHIPLIPSALRIRIIALTARAKTMFSLTIDIVLRDILTA